MESSAHYRSLASRTALPWWAEPAITDHVADTVEKYLGLNSASRLADLGAGSGSFASLLSTRAGLTNPVTCVEPSQEMIDLGIDIQTSNAWILSPAPFFSRPALIKNFGSSRSKHTTTDEYKYK